MTSPEVYRTSQFRPLILDWIHWYGGVPPTGGVKFTCLFVCVYVCVCVCVRVWEYDGESSTVKDQPVTVLLRGPTFTRETPHDFFGNYFVTPVHFLWRKPVNKAETITSARSQSESKPPPEKLNHEPRADAEAEQEGMMLYSKTYRWRKGKRGGKNLGERLWKTSMTEQWFDLLHHTSGRAYRTMV